MKFKNIDTITRKIAELKIFLIDADPATLGLSEEDINKTLPNLQNLEVNVNHDLFDLDQSKDTLKALFRNIEAKKALLSQLKEKIEKASKAGDANKASEAGDAKKASGAGDAKVDGNAKADEKLQATILETLTTLLTEIDSLFEQGKQHGKYAEQTDLPADCKQEVDNLLNSRTSSDLEFFTKAIKLAYDPRFSRFLRNGENMPELSPEQVEAMAAQLSKMTLKG